MWLNEGFARFYESEVAKIVFPEKISEIESQIFETLTKAFTQERHFPLPALNSIIAKPEEIEKKFNLLTYNKGAALFEISPILSGGGQ